jgi:hypothetical protein
MAFLLFSLREKVVREREKERERERERSAVSFSDEISRASSL